MSDFTPTSDDLKTARAWPFEEAKALMKRLARLEKGKTSDRPIRFETGYGPSGLPHIGTFGEVARTTMVRRAFEALTGRPTELICVSDDMDGLRKVPDNIPNKEMLEPHLQKPLTAVPDPFGTHESFAAHNNARLQVFLDQFGFDYNFLSATHAYKSGQYDAALLRMLEVYEDVMNIILPTIGEDRRQTYSPILPISPNTGRVLYVPMLEIDSKAGTIVFEDENGEKVKTSVTGGAVKLQWKADWAGRWFALGVDYEMAGEDLTESVKLSGKILRAMGGEPPAGFNYQLFLDEKGQKISKSKGNGISIDEWLRYASPDSLSLYMFQSPRKAKKLYFDIIPKTADEYWSFVARYHQQVADGNAKKALDNPVWHLHGGDVPTAQPPVTFSLLLNLVNASGTSEPDVLRGFVRKYRPEASDAEMQALEPMLGFAVHYYEDFLKSKKSYRKPNERERKALTHLRDALLTLGEEAEEGDYQTAVFDAGKTQDYDNIREWFTGLYETVFGQSEGPRMGAFIKVYGAKDMVKLIDEALAR